MFSQSEEPGYNKAEHKWGRTCRYQVAGFSHYIVVVFLAIWLLSVGTAQPQTNQTRRILILNSYHKGFKWTDDEVAGAEGVLTSLVKNLELYTEYLDTKRIRSDEYIQFIRQTLQLKYDKVKFDAIVATDDNALSFLLKYHEELFGEVPVVFCGVNDFEDSMLEGQDNFTGLTEALEIKPTIDTALKLHPGTKKIVVISDGTPTGLGQRKTIMAVARQYEDLEFEYLNGEDLSTAELLKKLRGLPHDSIALLATWMWDKRGAYVLSGDISSLSLIPSSSVVPVYGFTDMWLNSGIVGGKLLSGRTHGRDAADLVLRILGGEKPADIPIRTKSNCPYMFSYDQLKRWQIDMADLPQDSTIFNEPQNLYYLYKTQIWAVVAIIAGLTAVVVILSASILHRKRVEESLKASEQRYILAQRIAKMATWESNLQTGKLHWSKECDVLFGFAPGQSKGTRDAFYDECVYPKDRQYVLDSVQACIEQGKEYNIEHRIIRADGAIRWVSQTADVFRDENGEPIHLFGVIQDITERKQAEEALRKSEESYRTLYESSRDGIATANLEGTITGCNRAYADMMGYTREEIKKIRYQDITPSRWHALNEKILQEVMERGYSDVFEKEYVRKDGTVFPVALRAWRIDDENGNPVGVGSIVRDITERKRAQERIAKLNNCFLNFGPNPDENIKALTVITGELLGARCSLYNRLEGDMLCSLGQWNTPAGYNPKDRPEGHICYDVIQKGGDNVFLVRNLQNTLYAKTDPNVVPYKLETYFGRVVKCGNASVGSLCAVYQKDFIPDENDEKLIGILASAIGVEEERKHAEEATARSESIYRGAIENTQGVPYQVRYSDGKYVFMGSGAEELLGISPEKLTREKFCEMVEDVIITDMAGHEGLEDYRKAFEEGKIGRYQADLHYRTPKGQMKWFSDCSVPVRDEKTGEVTGALGILQDITERKRIEEALRESEEKFRTIFNTATDGILVAEPKSKRLHTGNKMLCKMLGYSLEEIQNLKVSDIHPDKDLHYVMEQFDGQAKGKFTLAESIPTKRKDGSVFYADVNSSPITLAGKTYVMGIFRDITEHKEAEEKLLDYQKQLKSLASELLLAEERERRHIATELHDRINQALVISKIKLDSVRKSAHPGEFEKTLKEVCDSLGQTIQDTRSLTFDLSSPILYELGFEMAVSEWLNEQIQKKNGIATGFLDDGKPKPLDDDIRVLLFRTVRELLINVVKHARAKNVTVSTRKVDNEIEVSVEDNGVGFDPLEVGTMPDRIGRFGLFSIRERLEYLGGHINIDSKLGRGCRVTVTAPLKHEKTVKGAKK